MTVVERKRGDTYPEEFTIKGDGLPLDITSCTFKLTLDTLRDPPDATTNLWTIVGSIVGLPVNGKVSFGFTLGQVDHLGKFFYDIQMIDSAGYIRTVEKDKWNFVQDITKATT